MSNLIEGNNNLLINNKVSIFRNIKGYKFSRRLSIEEGRTLSKLIQNVLLKNIKNLEVIDFSNDKEKINYYKDLNLITNSFIKNKELSAFLIDNEKKFSVIINENEHIRLQYVNNGNNIKEMYEYLNKIDNLIENEFRYAFDDRLGYLMSDLSNLGTGIKVSITLHLPILTSIDKIVSLSKSLELNNLSIRGLYGERGKSYGNVYEISNKWSFGLNEEDIITNLQNNIINIVNEEINQREKLFIKNNIDLEDRVYRAYGILKNARKITLIEGLNLLSDLRLGAELSILDVNIRRIDELSILIKDSIIKSNINEKVLVSELDIERANVIRNILE